MTPAGVLVVTTAFGAGLLGVDTRLSLAHTVFAVGISLMLVGFIGRGRLRPALEITRHLPRFVTVGKPAHYVVTLRNVSTRTLDGLTLDERLQQRYPDAAAFARRRTRATNWFDRAVGYPDWLDWLQRLRRVAVSPADIPVLKPRQSAEVTLALQPLHRGVAFFEGFAVTRGDPLGLWRSLYDAPGAEALVVLPQIHPVKWPVFSGSRHYQPGGISQASRVGDSEEFRSLRDYRPGDPLRAIHWRSWARTGRPVVKEYQEEYFTRHALVLDTATTATMGEAFEAAVSVAASYAVASRGTDSLLDLLFVGEDAHRITVGRGVGTSDTLLRVLAAVETSPPESFARLARSVTAHAPAISSAILVLQAWDEQRARLVAALLGLHIGVRAYVVAESIPDVPVPAVSPEVRWVQSGAVREALAES
ncbi:MAG: DUF58 domain-containing protein [Betaproteobacteria bacterium]|nr:DUF58 domain-containing protein [Betaproteobacteria bacterium]